MDQITKRHDGKVTWIVLSSVNNTIGTGLLNELEAALEECADSLTSRALIITGAGKKFFSPGLNLHEVSRLGRAEMFRFMRRFSRLQLRLFTYPKPVLVLLNGDALAGGFFLASSCDFRYGRRGIKLGLTRLSRSVIMPRGSLRILEHLIGRKATERIASRGGSFSAPQALQMGWLDGIFAGKDLEKEVRLKAFECVGQTADFPPYCTKAERGRVTAEILNKEETDLEVFLDHWFRRDAQRRMKEILRKLDRKGEQSKSLE